MRYVTQDGNFLDGYAYGELMLRNAAQRNRLQNMNNPRSGFPQMGGGSAMALPPHLVQKHYQQMRGHSKDAADIWLYNYNRNNSGGGGFGGGSGGGGGGGTGGGSGYQSAATVDAQIAQDPTKGARERMMRAQMAASQAGTTAAGQAVAGGAYGSSRAGLIGGGNMIAQAAAQGALAADQFAEQDLQRQQGVFSQNAAQANEANQFNAAQSNQMQQFLKQYALDQYRAQLEAMQVDPSSYWKRQNT